MRAMSDLDWSTPEGLAAIRDHLAARIDGWRQPVAHAVGAQPRVVVAGVGVRPRQRPGRAARPAGRRARHACWATTGRRRPCRVSRAELAAAVESLEPARACTSLPHPNLAAWREVLHELEGNPAREAQAVFVADLDDPVDLGGRRVDAGDVRGPRPGALTRAHRHGRPGTHRAARALSPRTHRAAPWAATASDRPAPHPEGPPCSTPLTSLLEAGAAAPWVLARRPPRRRRGRPRAADPQRGRRRRARGRRRGGARPEPAAPRAGRRGRRLPRRHPDLPRRPPATVPAAAGPRDRARRARRLLDRASGTLERRGALVVLTARYVPLGRVAVNLTAGATGFPPRRFAGLAALAAATWAAWSVAVGALAGHWLDGNPLLGSAGRHRPGPRPRPRRRPGRPPAHRLGPDAGRARHPAADCASAPGGRRTRAERRAAASRPRGSGVCTLHPRVPIMALALSS